MNGGYPASWSTRISALSNFRNVDVVGQTSYSYPSIYTNYRQYPVNLEDDNFIIKKTNNQVIFHRIYQVGGKKRSDDWNFNEQNDVYGVRTSKNGKGILTGYLPGDKKTN